MSELISDYVNYSKKRGECIERVVEMYDSADAVKGHELREEPNIKKSIQTQHTGGTPCGRGYWLTAVCLLLLCVLLLTAVTVLWIKYNNLNIEKDQLQTSYNNLNIQRDQLQTRYNDMKNENNQLKFQKGQLVLHRDQLMLQRDQLCKETSGLQNVLLKFGWRFFNSSLYKISAESKRWDDSQVYCTAIGADLVTVNSKEEQEFISESFSTEAWIGLNDQASEGKFKWVDGSPLTTVFWWDGEPNNFSQNEDCVLTGYLHANSNMSTWADFPCSYRYVAICEMKIIN